MELNLGPSADEIFNEKCCYFCRETANFTKKDAGTWGNDYYCPHCGHYQITRKAIINLGRESIFRVLGASIAQGKKLAGQDDYILDWRENQEEYNERKICIGDVPFLNSYPNDYLEKLDRILINIGRKTNNSPLDYYQPDYHDFGLFFVEPQSKFYFDEKPSADSKNFINAKIVQTIDILEQLDWVKQSREHVNGIHNITLTIQGLKRLHELLNLTENKTQPFVAMWFPSDGEYVGVLNNYVNSITKAILQAGYSAPYIANRDKYNGAIMNKVINQIRESRFLIADLTCDKKAGMRGGVYYEAGMAAGLGMPVILTCHKKAQKFVHFDLKQFNTIFWNIDKKGIIRAEAEPEVDFSDYLAEWIIKTIGKKK